MAIEKTDLRQTDVVPTALEIAARIRAMWQGEVTAMHIHVTKWTPTKCDCLFTAEAMARTLEDA